MSEAEKELRYILNCIVVRCVDSPKICNAYEDEFDLRRIAPGIEKYVTEFIANRPTP